MFLFTGTGSRRAEPVSRNGGTGAFGTRAVYRRLGLRLWKQDLHWKQRIQNKYVHYHIANPCSDRAKQSPAVQKNDFLFSQASPYQVSYTRNNSFPLTSGLLVSHSFVLETPSLPSTGSRQMTNTNLIRPPFCQHNDDGFQILFCHLFQSVSSNKNSHLPPISLLCS